MAVTVLPDVIPALRSQPGSFVRLEIMSGHDAGPGPVADAARAAVRELSDKAPRNAPVMVTGPCAIPGGCLLIAGFDAGTGKGTLARVPATLARHLEGPASRTRSSAWPAGRMTAMRHRSPSARSRRHGLQARSPLREAGYGPGSSPCSPTPGHGGSVSSYGRRRNWPR
jgi:hypothetical protein